MTETAVEPAAAVDGWLSSFEAALTEGDSEAAAALFAEESFWRDLVAFTWNIKTVEGPAEIKEMLDHTLGRVKPRGWPQEVADKVGKVWGLGSDTTKDPGPWEGEQRNMWKPTQQEALWFHGGNLHQSRHYSLFLALQLKARAEGIDTPVYGLQEVHHLR